MIVVVVVDPRYPGYPQPSELDHPRVAKVEDVGCHPTSITKFSEMVGCLVITSYKQCQYWSLHFTRVVFVECSHCLVLVRYLHPSHVLVITKGLQRKRTQNMRSVKN
jgi:hypothetical protein